MYAIRSYYAFEIFKKTIDTRPHEVKTVFFGGMGEPLYHPRILDMIEMCKENRLYVELLSNGTMLTPNFSKALLDSGLNKLWISLDFLKDEENSHTESKNSGHPNS